MATPTTAQVDAWAMVAADFRPQPRGQAMTKAEEKECVEFHVLMKGEFPATYTHDVARELLRLARQHGLLQEKACNEQVPEGHDKSCEDAITSLCNALGVPAVLFSGDPRGYTVKLRLPSGRSNHWGGDTWGVPQ